jgi:hypothetical protein
MQIIKGISLIFALTLLNISNQLVRTSKNKTMLDNNEKPLKVMFDLPAEIQLGQVCEIRVEILNVSNSSTIINKRLSVGYQHSLSRELYVTICKPDAPEDVGIQKVLYDREFSPPEDYIQLLPNQQIFIKFNLFEWYEIPKTGKYIIRVCYQADENLAYKPDGLCEGIFCSEEKSVIFK